MTMTKTKTKKTTKKPLTWEKALGFFETHLRAKRSSERTVYEYL